MSLYGQLMKQEADYTKIVDEKLIECDNLIKNNRFQDAIDMLYQLEKQARTVKQTTFFVVVCCVLCHLI